MTSPTHTEFDQPLDLQALEYFVQIAKAGGFSKASAVLNLSQPTLTRHVQQLEKQVGARVFDRTGRGIVLTEAGDSLLRHAEVILNRVQQARAEISDITKNPAGSVVLGLAPITGKVLSVPVAKRFLVEVPNAQLRIVECFTGYVNEWIASGRIDIGILYADSNNACLNGEKLWKEQYIVVSKHGGNLDNRKEISFSDLKDLPLVLPSPPHGLRMKIDEVAARVGVTLNVILEINGLNAILDLVRQGVGYAILTPPALYGTGNKEGLVVTSIVRPTISSTVTAVCSLQRPVTNTTRSLLKIICEEARNVRQNYALNAA